VTSPARWYGGSFGEHAECILAPNPSPMTLDGTNTWVLRAEDFGRSVVIDPGPLDDEHLHSVADVAGEVSAVLLTHGHADHSEGARAFAERVGCGVRALDPTFVLGGEGLHDGDVVEVDGLEIRVVGTPGHSSDSLSFVVPADRAVLTGDTVLGRGTTVVAHPDGQLGAYLGSLRRLRDLAEAHEVDVIWPGHGPVLDQALPVIDFYLRHRAERLEQVQQAVAAGAVDAMDVVRRVYADVDERLWPAAELSVRAQLDYLHDTQPDMQRPAPGSPEQPGRRT
jgi:glyoxylase-like metal-dependent hydrolase (beta-lactamase superfamily II)